MEAQKEERVATKKATRPMNRRNGDGQAIYINHEYMQILRKAVKLLEKNTKLPQTRPQTIAYCLVRFLEAEK